MSDVEPNATVKASPPRKSDIILRRITSAFGMITYLQNLSSAFGWRYVVAVLAEYGGNQGMGWQVVNMARKNYVMDDMRLSAVEYGRLVGFAGIPWSAKAIFGLMSDLMPIGGLHRAPYLVTAGATGVASLSVLLMLPSHDVSWYLAAVLFLGYNLNVALADVVIDATVATRIKDKPEHAAPLQSLCWGSYGFFGVFVLSTCGYVLQAYGPHPLFALGVVMAAGVALPGCLGWLGEVRRPKAVRDCRQQLAHPARRIVTQAAALVGGYSLVMGALQLGLGHTSLRHALGVITLCGNALLCLGLWLLLRRLDRCLARATVYAFLEGALCPKSEILWQWGHAPTAESRDTRCYTLAQCSSINSSSVLAPNATVAEALPCGWALANGHPCISQIAYAWSAVAGSLALFIAATLYTTSFQRWRYRVIIATSQARDHAPI